MKSFLVAEISRKYDLNECSIEYQPILSFIPRSAISLLSNGQVCSTKVLRSVSASRYHAAAPYSPRFNTRGTGTNQSVTPTQLSLQPYRPTPYSLHDLLLFTKKDAPRSGCSIYSNNPNNPPRTKHTKQEITTVLK